MSRKGKITILAMVFVFVIALDLLGPSKKTETVVTALRMDTNRSARGGSYYTYGMHTSWGEVQMEPKYMDSFGKGDRVLITESMFFGRAISVFCPTRNIEMTSRLYSHSLVALGVLLVLTLFNYHFVKHRETEMTFYLLQFVTFGLLIYLLVFR